MTSIKKRMHYRINRLLYRLQWAVLKWTRGDCRHVSASANIVTSVCWTLCWSLRATNTLNKEGCENMANVKTICVCLPADRVEELRETAAKLGISVSALVTLRLAMSKGVAVDGE